MGIDDLVRGSGRSDEVLAAGQDNQTRRLFIGEFPPASDGESSQDAEWAGDEINVATKLGDIRVYYDDEVREPVTTRGARCRQGIHVPINEIIH